MNYLVPIFIIFTFTICSCGKRAEVLPTEVEAPYFTCQTEDLFQGQTAKIVDSLVEGGMVMGSAVSFSGHKPEQYKRFERLMASLSDGKLEGLTVHESPIIRSYGFEGMIKRAHLKTFDTFLNLFNDTSQVTTMFGCTIDGETVQELAIQFLASSHYEQSHYQLKPPEHIFLDSILLFNPGLNRSKNIMRLTNIYPTEQHYQPLKTMVSNDSMPKELMIGLANFRKIEDVPIFLSSFENRLFYNTAQLDLKVPLEITFRFPHIAFLPKLRKTQQKMLADSDLSARHSTQFYLAIFRYPPGIIASFLNEIEKQPPSYIKDDHLSGIWLAAQLNNSPEKRAFIPYFEVDEWNIMVLNDFRANKYYLNLY